jgi:hypothetical protein
LPTEAAKAMYVSHRVSLDEYAQALPRLDGQSGVVVGVAGGIACLDYVSRSDVFAGLYLKLLLISDPLSTCDARPQVLARPRRMGRMRR